MQITDYPKVISPLDFSVPGVTPTAFRTGSTACRVGAPDRRTHGGPRATWTGLVASVSGVTNGRSRAACGSVGDRGTRLSRTAGPILDGAAAARGAAGPIVMAPSSR